MEEPYLSERGLELPLPDEETMIVLDNIDLPELKIYGVFNDGASISILPQTKITLIAHRPLPKGSFGDYYEWGFI